MKISLYLLFVAALTGATANRVFKKHVLVNRPMNWSMARDYCKQNYVDLSIIDTKEEFYRFTNQTAANASVRSWIGLRKNPFESKYKQWCDGTMLNFTNWGLLDDIHEQHCITTQLNEWDDYSCTNVIPFYCSSEVTVIEEKKTWDEALEHCRNDYADLLSITTPNDLLVLNSINTYLTDSVWTGLHFLDGSWYWVKKKPLGSLVSLLSCPKQPFSCGAIKAGTKIWENRDCREKMHFICYH